MHASRVYENVWEPQLIALRHQASKALISELNTLRQLRHPHIVSLLGTADVEGEIWAVLEIAEHGSLHQVLLKSADERAHILRGVLPGCTQAFFRIAHEIAAALLYLQRQGAVPFLQEYSTAEALAVATPTCMRREVTVRVSASARFRGGVGCMRTAGLPFMFCNLQSGFDLLLPRASRRIGPRRHQDCQNPHRRQKRRQAEPLRSLQSL